MIEEHLLSLAAPKPPNEEARLEALRRYQILDTPREAAYDDIAKLAAYICEAPIAVVNLIDSDRQWFKSEIGLGVSETPLTFSICAHALLETDFLLVPDTLEDCRFRDNPLCCSEPNLRFYAGALLRSADGFALGTLCVLDRKPRTLNQEQQDVLRTLANQISGLLELRLLATLQAELIQQRDATNAELEKARAEAQQASLAKSTFLTSMSHELRTPLNAIIGYAELLDESADEVRPRELRADLAKIRGAGQQLLGLVNDVLDLAKVEAGKMEVFISDIAVAALLDEVAEAMQVAAARNRNTLRHETSDTGLTLRSDRQKLRQALVNLVANACKFTENGHIVLRAAAAGDDRVQIDVSDTGIGIESKYQDSLFHEFVQVSGRNEDRNKGTGLGLPISRKFCTLLGGSLTLQSVVGKGSTFTIILPDYQEPGTEDES